MSTEQAQATSPFDQFYTRVGHAMADENAGLVFEERAFLSHINLRGDPADAGFLGDTAGVFGFELPLTPNTWSGNDEVRVLWLGPDEWLIITTGVAQEWMDAIRANNEGRFIALTEVSGGQTVLRLSGERLRDVLAKGCTLDLHPRAFSVGQCAQSNLGKAPATFIHVDDAPVFEIVIRRMPTSADLLRIWMPFIRLS